MALKRERTKVRDRSSSKLPWLGRARGGGEGVGVVRRKSEEKEEEGVREEEKEGERWK